LVPRLVCCHCRRWDSLIDLSGVTENRMTGEQARTVLEQLAEKLVSAAHLRGLGRKNIIPMKRATGG